MTLHVRLLLEPTRAQVFVDALEPLTWEVQAAEFSARSASFAMLAALPYAISRGGRLHLNGSVDGRLLESAQLLSHYWAQWKPEKYLPVEISADRIEDEVGTGRERLICLSGGVDSTYAYLKVVHEKRPELRRGVALGVFVQGFDYGTDQTEAFCVAMRKIANMVAPSGPPVVEVKTNWKGVICTHDGANWEDFHPVGLASVMHLFAGTVGGAILASDYTFREDHVTAPWGSNSTTNRLLSSGGFQVEPLGEEATRTAKIEAISRWGKLEHIIVCWQGPRTGENCSRCEKCVRTMLMCEALGVDPAPAFGRSPTPEDVMGMVLSTEAKRAFIRQAIEAFRDGNRPELKRAAQAALAQYE